MPPQEPRAARKEKITKTDKKMFTKLYVSSKSKNWIFLLNFFLGLVSNKKIHGLYFYDWFLSEKNWRKLVL